MRRRITNTHTAREKLVQWMKRLLAFQEDPASIPDLNARVLKDLAEMRIRPIGSHQRYVVVLVSDRKQVCFGQLRIL